MTESSNDRPTRKKEAIRSREQEELLEQIDRLWKTNFSFIYLILCNTFDPLCIFCLNYLCLDIFIMFTRCLQETLLDKTGRLGRLDYHSSHSLSYDFHYRLIPLFLQLTSSLFYLNISIIGFIHWITFCQLMYLG